MIAASPARRSLGLRRRRALAVGFATLLALVSAPLAAADSGSFTSSDPLLNQIWSASVTTATDMLAPGPLTTDANNEPCVMNVSVAILDGKARDRCPYIGDEAVTGMTLLVSTPSAESALRDELAWFASAQAADGTIPASPIFGNTLVLFDYESYWVQSVYDYVLYTGDLSLATQVWPNLIKLMNTWYPSHAQAGGLVANNLGPADYAFIRRQGTLVAYFNAGYVLALHDAAQLATWTGDTTDAQAWTARATALVAPFNAAFYDSSTGAYIDTPTGPPVHPQDGNVFAILAGLTSPAQTASALNYLSSADTRPWGNTIVDSNSAWGQDPDWGTDPMDRAYPFISYFEVLARFQASLDDSAIDLIRREWGWMLNHEPAGNTTMWEDIGPDGGPPRDPNPSYDHGWSSGAAPALTSYVLGVRPTSPGFATFVVDPHPGTTVTSASGVVPTPQGDISVSWLIVSGKPLITVKAPPGEVWTNAPPLPVQATTTTTTVAKKPPPKPKAKTKVKAKVKLKPAKKQKLKAKAN